MSKDKRKVARGYVRIKEARYLYIYKDSEGLYYYSSTKQKNKPVTKVSSADAAFEMVQKLNSNLRKAA